MMNNASSSASSSSSTSAASSPYTYMPFSATSSTPNAPASQMTSPGSAAAQAAIHIHGLRQEHLDHVGSGGGSPSAQLSAMHPSLRPSASPSGSSPSSISVSLGGIGSTPTASVNQHHHSLNGNGNSNGNGHPSNGLPPINTDMLANFSSMLPSPQPSSQLSSSASAGSVLPTTPPQTADLDTILAMYAGQPELLKLIIASKTEEDRRWAEEARFKMMDLMMRENRGMPLMTGYEGLLAPSGTPTSGAGATGADPGTAAGTPAISTTTAGPPASGVTTTVVGSNSVLLASLGMNSSTKRYMDDDDEGLDQQTPGTTGSGAGNASRGPVLATSGLGNGPSGQGDLPHPGLSRKRSVTFAREVHSSGHLRSQSMSSMPSGTGSSVQMGVLSMMPLNGSTQSLASQPPPPPQSMEHHSQLQQHQGLPPPLQQHTNGLSMQQQYQQHQFQQQQQQQQQQFQQQAPHLSHHNMPPQPPQHQLHSQNQQLPPQFGQYPPMFSYHGTLPNLPSQQIRRTSSLSHLSQFAQNSHMVGSSEQQQRLAAGRSRNFGATSHRAIDDSDDDESDDDDYGDHPVMGLGNSSRPGSSLGMNNTLGGTGEVSITHEFSDMLSGSSGLGGGGGGGHHGHGHSHSHGGGPFGGASHHQMFQTHQQPPAYPNLSQQQQQQHHQQYSASSPSSSTSSTASNSMAILSTLHAGLGTVVNSNVFNTGVVSPNVTLVRSSSAGGRTSSQVAASDSDPKKKRKRREMQPVNQIIETFEPHVDQYLWKNNGNTIQKKTKCKSIYYKCSNSGGGCTVNKTVTEKEGGGFITKYRGHHLPDCINFKRAQMAVQAAQAAQNAYTLEKEQ